MRIQNCKPGVFVFLNPADKDEEKGKTKESPPFCSYSIPLVRLLFFPLGKCQRHQKVRKITLTTSIFIQSSSSCLSVFLSAFFLNPSFPDYEDKKDSLRKDRSKVSGNEFNLSRNETADHKPPELTERLVYATNHQPLVANRESLARNA